MKRKTSIVFGGSKGIGSVISKVLKKRGDKLYVVSRRGNNFSNSVSIDLLDEEDIRQKLKKLFNRKKINNLIFSHRYRGDDTAEDFQVTLHSVGLIIDLLKDKLSKNSSIVIINSIAIRTIIYDQPQRYHVIRGALEQLVKYNAASLGNKGIRVNCILVTKIIKPENKKYFLKKSNPDRKMMESITPLKRMGTALDVAHLVDFLTSDKSTFLTGLSIPIDGGTRLLSQETITTLIEPALATVKKYLS